MVSLAGELHARFGHGLDGSEGPRAGTACGFGLSLLEPNFALKARRAFDRQGGSRTEQVCLLRVAPASRSAGEMVVVPVGVLRRDGQERSRATTCRKPSFTMLASLGLNFAATVVTLDAEGRHADAAEAVLLQPRLSVKRAEGNAAMSSSICGRPLLNFTSSKQH